MEAAHSQGVPQDSYGRFIGVQTAVLAVLLSIFTIFTHRAHTDTVTFGNAANNAWSHYQAKRSRAYQIEMNTGLVKLMAPNSIEASQTLAAYAAQSKKYDKELKEIAAQGEFKAKAEEIAHGRAGFFDLAEGILEISMILSSLYFISRSKLLPTLGLCAGLIGVAAGLLGLFLR